MVERTNRPVLILTPLAVAQQTVKEGEKFGVKVVRSAGGRENWRIPRGVIFVTNYEKLHHFDPSDFAGVVCDESSAIKSFDGRRRAAVTEFLRTIPYRLLKEWTRPRLPFTAATVPARCLPEHTFPRGGSHCWCGRTARALVAVTAELAINP